MNSHFPNRGLYSKYQVRRRMDPDRKHIDCQFFVLDPGHDDAAQVALIAYADAVEATKPQLAQELRRWMLDLALEYERE